MEYDSTKYLEKSYLRVKLYERNDKGSIWVKTIIKANLISPR